MIVIIVIALVVTELLNAVMKNSRFEGMTTTPDENKDKKNEKSHPASEVEPETLISSTTDNKGEEAIESSKETNKKPTPEEVKKVQEELKENQDKIIQGFQSIEPYMNRAEGLVNKINQYAKA